jgi:hypothetical protein
MGIGIHKAAKEAEALRQTINRIFTEEFKARIERSLDNVNKYAEDPHTRKLFLSLTNFLDNINGTSIIANADKFLETTNKLLEKVDKDDVKQIVHSFNQLLQQAVDSHLMDHINAALEGVASIKHLEEFAEKLMTSKIGTALAASALLVPIGGVLYSWIQQQKEAQKDKIFAELLDNSKIQTFISIANFRNIATSNWLDAQKLKIDLNYDKLSAASKKRVDNIIAETEIIMDKLKPLSEGTLECLAQVSLRHEKFIKKLCEKEYSQTTEELMDQVPARDDIDDDNWEHLINRIVYQKKEKVHFKRTLTNYDEIRRTHGGYNLDEIMQDLAKIFEEQGHDLYYCLGVIGQDDSKYFRKSIINIPSSSVTEERYKKMKEENPLKPAAVKKLLEFYHGSDGAKKVVEDLWLQFMRLDFDLINLEDKEIEIIVLRAFLQYCKNTAGYLFFPYDISRTTVDTFKHVTNSVSSFFSRKPGAEDEDVGGNCYNFSCR